jgi:hypothetical protein
MRIAKTHAWVVYSIPVKNSTDRIRAVCDAQEWSVLDGGRPGYYSLIRAGIANEAEAERLARGSSGATVPRQGRAIRTWPGESVAPITPPDPAQ